MAAWLRKNSRTVNMKNIREPFYSAGKKYGWPYKSIGLGINKNDFSGESLSITVGDDPTIWTVNTEKALDVVHRYKAYYNARGTELFVVPWDLFKRVKNELNQDKLDI